VEAYQLGRIHGRAEGEDTALAEVEKLKDENAVQKHVIERMKKNVSDGK
jgi:hypothetical protein